MKPENTMTLKTEPGPPAMPSGEGRGRAPYTPGAVAFVLLLVLAGALCAQALLEEVLA
ncbi:hypothetical protein M942_00135 [Enterobacter ludwigii]|jgi:hypothetical protein|uniref:hypothetical protein n=1 Tax=Enterobacter ludwigii TaxID=299767 RepID=UPI0003D857DD|nr:hypothetical protein [Enterobacter ludwigii]AHE72395.1 hypothetical protein M942_00135 [Enterobacter ludwigii]